jgi:tetratricopeptide (TPR) repeat protein
MNQNLNPEQLNNLAKQHFDKKEFKQALDLLNRPDLPQELYFNLAKCYYYTCQADKALDVIKDIPNKDTEQMIDYALYLNAIGEHQKAFEIYKTLDQSNPKVLFNIGWHYLRNNQFKTGFQHIQHGDKVSAWGHEYIYIKNGQLNKNKRWTGEYTDHLLLILEGGLGDEMIFLRWANHLKTQCKKLTILCNMSLLRLFTNAGYNCEPHSSLPYIEYTSYCPAMSLPAIIDIQTPTHFVDLPYIKSFAEPFIIKQMDKIAKGRKKIGVRFYGNKDFEHDQFRSPPRQELENLNVFGQLFSLQIDEDENNIPNCKYLINDWQDTYSVFKGLDLLVTSCTSTAHLAGAMGIKCIVLVPLVPYFIWASDDMLWYGDNVHVIRQTKYNDWSEAMDKMKKKVLEIL